MTQLNFQIPEEINNFLEEMGNHEGLSKSAYAKKLFLSILSEKMMPKLAEFYKKGEISLKKIAKITNTPHTQVIKKIASLIDDIDIDKRILEYTEQVSNEAIPLFTKHVNFDDSIL
ncbi:MAG: hypothetical protein K9W44_05175 [Candidatus Lokiarchaeota archaeon]|nr:hypothetical protein [Candidatus Harpocratesius repetitus]